MSLTSMGKVGEKTTCPFIQRLSELSGYLELRIEKKEAQFLS